MAASRRLFLAAAGGLAGALGTGTGARAAPASEPFWGAHQGGILTPAQSHTCFAVFDVVAESPDAVAALLKTWTTESARMTRGEPARPMDSGEALGLPASRLTLTFGFGPGLFVKDGNDRFGLAARRPAALVDLPRFNGDQLIEAQTGGDLSVQACADDAQVAFHAVRQLARLAYNVAEIRWMQVGFLPDGEPGQTPRNLMGFKDGTQNPLRTDGTGMLWVDEDGPNWMRGGTYLVARRIRISLEHWDRTETGFQEQVIGRHKLSGAPLGGTRELDALDLDATDKDGNPRIAEDAHVRLGAAATNGGAQLLRRGYAYNNGVTFLAERWPPWRQGMLYDAGLLFMAYQRDPRTGFIKIYENMAKLDALNQFTTHVGSGVFACPGGVREGEFVGQGLFAGSATAAAPRSC